MDAIIVINPPSEMDEGIIREFASKFKKRLIGKKWYCQVGVVANLSSMENIGAVTKCACLTAGVVGYPTEELRNGEYSQNARNNFLMKIGKSAHSKLIAVVDFPKNEIEEILKELHPKMLFTMKAHEKIPYYLAIFP